MYQIKIYENGCNTASTVLKVEKLERAIIVANQIATLNVSTNERIEKIAMQIENENGEIEYENTINN